MLAHSAGHINGRAAVPAAQEIEDKKEKALPVRGKFRGIAPGTTGRLSQL
jgi:hypothetical protein